MHNIENMRKTFIKIAMAITVSVLGTITCAAQEMKPEVCDSISQACCKSSNRLFDIGAEFSVSPRSHGLTPLFFDAGVSVPVKRMMFDFGYRYLLATYKKPEDKTYLTSHGLAGAVGYRVFNNNGHDYWLLGKDGAAYVKLRYAHSIGSPDLKYSMYELGIFESSKRRNEGFGIGLRYIDSQTEGIKNHFSVFFSYRI